MVGKRFRFTQAARKHRIGRAHALAAIRNAGDYTLIPASGDQDTDRLAWIGVDDRGVELEILAVETPDCLLVIDVMPTAYRRRQS